MAQICNIFTLISNRYSRCTYSAKYPRKFFKIYLGNRIQWSSAFMDLEILRKSKKLTGNQHR